MPQKFTFPTIQQAISLQKAESMEDIKVSLRNWFTQNPSLKISQNVAWSFKICHGDQTIRRYIHCKYCPAKIIYVKNNCGLQDKISNTYKLSKFNLHHDHRFIQSVKQKGKLKTFPQIYAKSPEFPKKSIQRQRKDRQNKLRKKRQEFNKYKKLELYYRLSMSVKNSDKTLINVKELAAKSLGVTVERFMNFLNSPARAAIEVAAIKKLLKNAGFEKYNVEIDSKNFMKSEEVKIQDSAIQKEAISEKTKSKSNSLILEESKEFFKNLMIFVNYNEKTKMNLQKTQGVINITHLESKVLSKKFMSNLKWDSLLFYSHDENFVPNQLYAIIMIDSSRFTIKQIKKSFEITFKLLDPLKKIQFQCCIHQQNIYIMGALDLIIEQIGQKKNLNLETEQSFLSLNYILSPKLSTSIINKCEFIPKIFRKKLIEKIYELDPKEIDAQFSRIVTELEKASQIKEYKVKTEQYLAELKEFSENFHKIFLGKIMSPSFVSLVFSTNISDSIQVSMDELLSIKLAEFSQDNKYFLEFFILIFDVFRLPGGSFIYKRDKGHTRESTKVEEIYTTRLVLQEYQYFDEIKKFYNAKACRGKYEKHKSQKKNKDRADFFDEFSAITYERLYKIKQIFVKTTPEVMTVLLRQIQKSFTLQIQTKTIDEVKSDGLIRVKQSSKEPYTIRILDRSRFWPTEKEKMISNAKSITIIESDNNVIELENTENTSKTDQNDKGQSQSKRLWQCNCNWSKFTFLPCSHEIRCCLTFFTSIEDQIDDFWLYDPKVLYQMQQDDNKSRSDNSDNDNSEKQNNSESD